MQPAFSTIRRRLISIALAVIGAIIGGLIITERIFEYRGMGDFMIIQVICLAVVVAFPDIVLWLPRSLR